MSSSRKNTSNRPVPSIPVSLAEKMVYALYWIAFALSVVVAILAFVYLPERPVVHAANGSGTTVVRDRFALTAFSFVVLCVAPVIAYLPRSPLDHHDYP